MNILFCHPGRALLPELVAYKRYCADRGWATKEVTYCELRKTDFSVVGVVWNIMGWHLPAETYQHLRRNGCLYVKEYASLSVGRFAKLKNIAKSFPYQRADVNVYLNELVYKEYSCVFKKTNVCFRDMAVTRAGIQKTKGPKLYDLVYVGALDDDRDVASFINKLHAKIPGLKTVVVGEPSAAQRALLASNSGVTLVGRVEYEDVGRYIISARAGINYIPDKYPYNIQTSTKFLEYLACGIPVLSNRYEWVSTYKLANSSTLLLVDDASDVEFHSLEKLFSTTVAEDVPLWSDVIDESNVFQTLEGLLSG